MIGTALTATATMWLVGAEWVGSRRQLFMAKPLASLGFLLVPLLAGRAGHPGTAWLIGGLALGAIGDVVLMFDSSAMFTVGLIAFLFGHAAYVVGFSAGALAAPAVIGTSIVMGMVAIGTVQWLRPHLRPPFNIAVPLYVLVISAMVVSAIGSTTAGIGAKTGAALFAASDLAVARERFVRQSRWNRVLGLPMYYAAQLLIAWSVTPAAG